MELKHDSDCATHNMPAYPNGPCNCSVSQHWRNILADLLDNLGTMADRRDDEPISFRHLDELVLQLRKPLK